MRHAERVARDGGLRGNRRRDLAGGLRQRPISDPINGGENQHQQNRYAQVDELQGSSGKHWDDSTVPLFQRRDISARMAYRFVILAAVLLLNGFFATAEVALISVRKSRLRTLAEEGQVGAQAALNLLANPSRLLSLTQAGVTLASLGLGWAGENTVYELLQALFHPIIVAALGSRCGTW